MLKRHQAALAGVFSKVSLAKIVLWSDYGVGESTALWISEIELEVKMYSVRE